MVENLNHEKSGVFRDFRVPTPLFITLFKTNGSQKKDLRAFFIKSLPHLSEKRDLKRTLVQTT